MFWRDLLEAETKRAAKPKAVKPQDVVDLSRTGCDACSLKQTWVRIATPRMSLSGNRAGRVLALAEGPGEIEDRDGEALVGPSGKLLRENIPGRYRDEVAFQNIVRCRPDDNRTPTMQEAHCCSVHLDADIADMPNLEAILGIGSVPLRRFFPGASIMRIHGLKFPVRVGKRSVWYWPVLHPAFVLHQGKEKQERGFDPPALPVFRSDVQNFFKQLGSWDKPRITRLKADDVVMPKTYEEARECIRHMSEPIGVDLETIKLRPYEHGAALLTAAFSDDKLTIAFPINHPTAPTDWGLRLLLETIKTKHWVAHNAAFELSWFLHHFDEVHNFDDSMAVARLYQEREGALDLGSVSHMTLGTDVKRIMAIDTNRILDYSIEEVLRYNGLDAKACRLCWQQRIGSVDRQNYERIIGSIWSTSRMELAGLPASIGRAVALQEEWSAKAARIRADASKLYEVRQYEMERATEFNIASSEQVGAALVAYGRIDLPRTAKGKQYSTDDEVLHKYADSNPLVRAVLDYREATGMTKYIDPTLEAPKRYPDGIPHPTYTTMFTATQRLSSRDPNIQNYPARKHGEIRRQFIPPEGCLFAKFDYGQLEARVLAMASRDRVLCQSIINKFDIHSHWLNKLIDDYFEEYLDRLADKLGVTDEKKLRKSGRDLIKSDLVFNALYGGGADSIAERTGIPLRTVLALLEEFWDTYRGVKAWHKIQRNLYHDAGITKTLTNRVRHGILIGNEPINNPIQGTAADIVIESMNEIAALARKENDFYLHPRINVHDDLTFFLPDNEKSMGEYIDIVHPILTKVRFDWQIVPLSVELKVGEDWSDMHEVATFEGGYNK